MAESPVALADLLGTALIRLMREHRAAVAAELVPLGLHPGQELLLDVVVRSGGASQTQLARAMGVEGPTVTKMLQRLAGSGLLDRRPDPEDGRLVRVWPTDQAREVHTEMLRRWAAVDARMLRDLPVDLPVVRDLVAAMTANLSAGTTLAGGTP